jgi:hypothetical protein
MSLRQGVLAEEVVRMNDDIEDRVFAHMMRVYPHQFYELDPERFWRLYHEKYPDCTRADMERALKESEHET